MCTGSTDWGPALWTAWLSSVSCLLILLFPFHSPASPIFPPPVFSLPTLVLCAHVCVCVCVCVCVRGQVSVPTIAFWTCQICPVSVLPSSELTGAFPHELLYKG